MSSNPPAFHVDLPRLQRLSLLVGLGAAVVWILGGIFQDWNSFFRSYLAAYQLFVGIAVGCLVWIMIYHLTGGAWGYVIRHILEAGTRTLPLLAVLFVPLAFGLGNLYRWTDPQFVHEDPYIRHKAVYLNIPFFLIRTAIYFACWIALAFVMNRWSDEQDRQDVPTLPRKFRLLAAPGLVVYGLTITFAGIDWVMSLQPAWYSTIFSVILAVGQILSGIAFAIIVLALLRDRPPLGDVASAYTLNDLGNLLLTFVVLWIYMTFAQYLLYWAGNIPEEIAWYIPRTSGGWGAVALALAFFHFLVPFFLLLSRTIKRNPRSLALVAGGLLFMQLVQLYWQVLPAFGGLADVALAGNEKGVPAAASPALTAWALNPAGQWMDLFAPVALGGLFVAYYIFQLGRRPLLPRYDPNQMEAAALHHMGMPVDPLRPEVRHNG